MVESRPDTYYNNYYSTLRIGHTAFVVQLAAAMTWSFSDVISMVLQCVVGWCVVCVR